MVSIKNFLKLGRDGAQIESLAPVLLRDLQIIHFN